MCRKVWSFGDYDLRDRSQSIRLNMRMWTELLGVYLASHCNQRVNGVVQRVGEATGTSQSSVSSRLLI